VSAPGGAETSRQVRGRECHRREVRDSNFIVFLANGQMFHNDLLADHLKLLDFPTAERTALIMVQTEVGASAR
jgi:hypothetical protein